MILGVYGYHDSGKTTFLERLMPELKSRRISAGVIKHMCHSPADGEQTDTRRLERAGYDPVIGISEDGIVIEQSDNLLRTTIDAMHRLASVDLILVEGFKSDPMDKIAIGDIDDMPGTIYRGDQFDEIIQYIVEKVNRERDTRGDEMADIELTLKVNGREIPTNEFVRKMLWETLAGMARSLKKVDVEIDRIEISAKKE